jgi:hypothetical protein
MTRLALAILLTLPVTASANLLLAPSSEGGGGGSAGSNVCKTAWVDQGKDNFGDTTLTVWINVGC